MAEGFVRIYDMFQVPGWSFVEDSVKYRPNELWWHVASATGVLICKRSEAEHGDFSVSWPALDRLYESAKKKEVRAAYVVLVDYCSRIPLRERSVVKWEEAWKVHDILRDEVPFYGATGAYFWVTEEFKIAPPLSFGGRTTDKSPL